MSLNNIANNAVRVRRTRPVRC